jgi:hypothetical protein
MDRAGYLFPDACIDFARLFPHISNLPTLLPTSTPAVGVRTGRGSILPRTRRAVEACSPRRWLAGWRAPLRARLRVRAHPAPDRPLGPPGAASGAHFLPRPGTKIGGGVLMVRTALRGRAMVARNLSARVSIVWTPFSSPGPLPYVRLVSARAGPLLVPPTEAPLFKLPQHSQYNHHKKNGPEKNKDQIPSEDREAVHPRESVVHVQNNRCHHDHAGEIKPPCNSKGSFHV